MLTFELTPDGDELEVHFDSHGAEELMKYLRKAVEHSDHQHLMTLQWGGGELTEEVQGEFNKLIHHVKLMVWPSRKDCE
jgi:hypothetical protein